MQIKSKRDLLFMILFFLSFIGLTKVYISHHITAKNLKKQSNQQLRVLSTEKLNELVELQRPKHLRNSMHIVIFALMLLVVCLFFFHSQDVMKNLALQKGAEEPELFKIFTNICGLLHLGLASKYYEFYRKYYENHGQLQQELNYAELHIYAFVFVTILYASFFVLKMNNLKNDSKNNVNPG